MTAPVVTDDALARSLLATCHGMGPARLSWLLGGAPAPEAFEALRRGRIAGEPGPAPPGVTPALVERWATDARKLDPPAVADALCRLGVAVLTPDSPGWPYADDPHPPAVLFARGHLGLLAPGPRAALVGTRRCSAVGRQAAFQLSRELAQGGAVVVSGLAAGIDGAAHAGALAATDADPAPTIAVVGTGLDRVYPAVNRRLWAQVGERGLLLSESPLGTGPEPWRFPARNRLIAGLCAVTVVVESHVRGGALLTANEAADRGTAVMAVPGAITSSASAGSNQLLADGCPPVCCAADVLEQLGFDPPAPADTGNLPSVATQGDDLGPLARLIVGEASAGAIHVDQLVALTGRPVPELMAKLQHLRAEGLIRLDGSTILFG
ncbi:MAG: DNA-protecting protein DprA [Acidimicrobiia bacterium]|nr:DNA-protecting protein DprA [Acidimicrobiia bacterium]MDH5290325.1 DNA-protecting protein DprA [Acidimicrobiia bacterium]